METRRVVITGLGCVSALGNSAVELWSGMKAGRSGIQRLERYQHFPASVFAPVTTDSWTFVEELDSAVRSKMTRAMHMFFAAVREALTHSNLLHQTDDVRVGLMGGTSGNYHSEILGADVEGQPEELMRWFAASADGEIDWARFLEKYQYPPNNFLRHMVNLLTCVPATHFKLRGINETTHNACAAGCTPWGRLSVRSSTATRT
jgi:3-oxoacyl-(acyl-carrier-protein) synthase